MTIALFIGIYVLCWFVSTAIMLRHYALGYSDPSRIDEDDMLPAFFMGVVWPLGLPFFLIFQWAKRPTKEQRRLEAEARVRQMERELGLS